MNSSSSLFLGLEKILENCQARFDDSDFRNGRKYCDDGSRLIGFRQKSYEVRLRMLHGRTDGRGKFDGVLARGEDSLTKGVTISIFG